MIADTSLQAYDKIKSKLPEKRLAVLIAAEKMSECCINTLANRMKLHPNEISGRTGELRKMGLLIDTKKKKLNGFMVQYFKAAKPERLF